jgi:osmotically-inducible protein OsmY
VEWSLLDALADSQEAIMSEHDLRDTQIQRDVLRELSWDTRLGATEVGVTVKRGVVTLSGRVESWGKRMAAQEAAHRVHGVMDVANDLEVKLPGSLRKDDGEIAAAVRLALRWDVLVPDEKIRSTVTDGVVTLEGEVECMTEHEDAARAVRNLAGVRQVRNEIKVCPSKTAADVRDAIKSALERHADREARHIDLNVTDGVVSIKGRVSSWGEKQLILGAARGTAGVRSIDDHIQIRF